MDTFSLSVISISLHFILSLNNNSGNKEANDRITRLCPENFGKIYRFKFLYCFDMFVYCF